MVRVCGTAPTLWQHRDIGPQMLCRLPPPFDDSFVTVQEWEFNARNQTHSLRLDFLHRICLPSTTPFESAAFYAKMRACTLGGMGLVTKEIQKYHIVDRLFTSEEAHSLLNDLGFYHSGPTDAIRDAFARIERCDSTNPRVVVRELLDEVETIPVAQLSSDAVADLHQLRHLRHRRRHHGNAIPYSYLLHLLYGLPVSLRRTDPSTRPSIGHRGPSHDL